MKNDKKYVIFEVGSQYEADMINEFVAENISRINRSLKFNKPFEIGEAYDLIKNKYDEAVKDFRIKNNKCDACGIGLMPMESMLCRSCIDERIGDEDEKDYYS